MHRTFFVILILTLLITSCGTFEVTLTNHAALTEMPPSDAAATPSAGPLSMESTSDQIRQALLTSPMRWRTIFMDAQVKGAGMSTLRVQSWVDQPNLSLRVLSGLPDAAAQNYRVANGMSQLDLNIQTGESNLSPFLNGSMQIPFTPEPAGQEPGVIKAHPLSASVVPLGELIFPSDIAQNKGTFKPVAMEPVAYKLTLVVEWTYSGNSQPSYRAWVDVSTGVFLRLQHFDKGGGTEVISDVTVTRVDYDLPYPAGLFSPVVTAMPNFVSDPEVPVYAEASPAAPTGHDLLGMVYSFVTDYSQPAATSLVRLPAQCVIGETACPQPEIIQTPVPIYSIRTLVWSPARNEAAWAYPLNPDQRIWTLYMFNANDNTWNELASFDRLMDPPMWSNDGTWLAFRLQDEKGSDIYAMRRDGSDMKILTTSEKLPAEGKPYIMEGWLGEYVIVRSSRVGAEGMIYMMRPEDGAVKPMFEKLLTKAPMIESPDGTTIAYVDYSYDNQKQVIRTVTPDGSVTHDLATFSGGGMAYLSWSPDGKQLAFVHLNETSASLYTIDSDGRNLRQVYNSNDNAMSYIFSPDMQYLLVQTLDGTGQHLYSIDLSTLSPHLVQAPGIDLNEAWLYPAWRK